MENGKNGNGNHPGMAVPVAPERAPVEGGAVEGDDGAVVLVEAQHMDAQTMIDLTNQFWLLKTRLITEADVQRFGDDAFVIASGYDRLGAALGLSETILGIDEVFGDDGEFRYGKVHIRIFHENTGRSVEGIGYCTPTKKMKDPIHDAMATAHTRSRKRAIDSFIGGVEPPAKPAPAQQQRHARR